MDIVLIPGLWLDGASWAAVTPALEAAGHRAHPLTLPGMESATADRSHITLADHVRAVVDAIDAIDGDRPVVIVGHSLGTDLGHAAVDARPDRVTRAIYIGGIPSADGSTPAGGLPAVDGEVPLPDWSDFDEAEVVGLDDTLRTCFRAAAIPSPAGVTRGTMRLSDDRRYDVPVTIICPEFTPDDVQTWLAAGELPEFARIHDTELVDIATGHWPQFSAPDDLSRIILAAIDRTGTDTSRADAAADQ